MNEKPMLAQQIEEWTREAILRWGDDWERVASYISMRFSETDEARQAELRTEADWTLAAGAAPGKDIIH